MSKDILIDENRDFKGVWIPKKLYMCRELTPNEKFVLIEIYSLSKFGECYATNSHFANFVGLSDSMIDKIISKLKKNNLIVSSIIRNPETKQVERRIISLTDNFFDKYINENVVNIPKRNLLHHPGVTDCEEKYNNNKNTKHYSATPSHESDSLIKAKSITNDLTVINAIEYYLSKYESEMGVKHPDITYSAMSRVIENICCSLQDVWDDIRADNGLDKMIDRHFDTNYGQPIDYKIQHFGTEGVLLYQARNCGYIDGYRD